MAAVGAWTQTWPKVIAQTWMSPWLQVAVQTTHFSMPRSRSRVYRYQWIQIAPQTPEISMAFSGNMGQRNQHGPTSLFILLLTKFRLLGLGTCPVDLVNPKYYSTSHHQQLESHHQSSFCHQQKRDSHKYQGINTFWDRETFILITWVLTTVFVCALE